MERTEIPLDRLAFDPALFRDRWLLLTAGDFEPGKFNSMTISWGSYGYLWNRLFVQVVVRPSRYTYKFMQNNGSFSLCVFPENCRPALSYLGSTSGRDTDKIRSSGLTPVPSRTILAPSYKEAELVLECHTMYWQDIDPVHFHDFSIENHYPSKDYHRAFFGEILAASGTGEYLTGKAQSGQEG